MSQNLPVTDLFTLQEVAEALGIALSQVDQARKAGELHATWARFPRRRPGWGVRVDDVQAWVRDYLDEHPDYPPGPLVSLPEAARRLKVPLGRLYTLLQKGLPCRKLRIGPPTTLISLEQAAAALRPRSDRWTLVRVQHFLGYGYTVALEASDEPSLVGRARLFDPEKLWRWAQSAPAYAVHAAGLPVLLTVPEAAREFGIPQRKVERAVDRQELDCLRVPGQGDFLSRFTLERWAAEQGWKQPASPYLTVSAAACETGLNEATIRRAVKEGRLASDDWRCPRLLSLIPRPALEAWARTQCPLPPAQEADAPLLGVQEAARRVGCSRGQIVGALKRGYLPFTWRQGLRWIRPADLETWRAWREGKNDPNLLNVKEAMRLTGLSRHVVRQAVRRGELAFEQGTLIRREALLTWMAKRGPAPQP